jgi:DNA processing protein
LIKQGAKLVESAEDVLEEFGSTFAVDNESQASVAVAAPEGPESALLQALGHDPVGLDALQARTGLPTPELQAELLTLELEGWVARLPGGLFQRCATA